MPLPSNTLGIFDFASAMGKLITTLTTAVLTLPPPTDRNPLHPWGKPLPEDFTDDQKTAIWLVQVAVIATCPNNDYLQKKSVCNPGAIGHGAQRVEDSPGRGREALRADLDQAWKTLETARPAQERKRGQSRLPSRSAAPIEFPTSRR